MHQLCVLHADQSHDSHHMTHELHTCSDWFLAFNLNVLVVLQIASGQADELKKSQEEVIKLQAEMSTLKTQRAQKGTVAHPSRDSSIKAHLPQPKVQHSPICC